MCVWHLLQLARLLRSTLLCVKQMAAQQDLMLLVQQLVVRARLVQ
jgi:hypothetical protein